MGVFNTIVDRGVIKVFGGGPLAYVATYGLRWLRESWDNDRSVQFVTSDEIRPGEQYSVIARPAPSRKERALLREKEKRAQVLVRLQRPTRKQRKLAQGIAALQSKQAKLNKKVQPEATGRRDRKRVAKIAGLAQQEQRLWVKLDKVDRRAAKRETLENTIGALAAAIAAEQAQAMAAATKKPRAGRSAVFRIDDRK